MYGRRTISRPIYGYVKKPNTPCSSDICLVIPTLSELIAVIESVTNVVDLFFPTAHARAPYIATMGAKGALPPSIFVRLAWRKTNPGVTFKGNRIQKLQIMDLYIQYGLNWTPDKLFNGVRSVEEFVDVFDYSGGV